MFKTGKLLLGLGFSMAVFAAAAQEPLDGAYVKTVTKEKEVIPYEFIREADVFWQKRIWRVIDIREKLNLPFAYPQEPLIQIIHEAAKNGEITVYDNSVENGDQFKKVLDPEDVKKIGAKQDTITTIDPETMEEVTKVINEELTWNKVKKFRVKEDWVFNEQTSSMMVRILGIAPILEVYNNGNYIGDEVMYWVYYPSIRPVLARYEVYNSRNDAERISWEDLFEARMFESYIYKESNVYDRNIKEYATGLDQLTESDRIKQKMFEFEHDLWSY